MNNNADCKKLLCVNAEEKNFLFPYGNFVPKIIVETDEFGKPISESYNTVSIDALIKKIVKKYDVAEEVVKSDILEFLDDIFRLSIHKKSDKNVNHEYWGAYTRIQQHYLKNRRPMKVFLELTYNCNLRCPHCYIQEELTINKDFPSYEKVITLIDQLSNSSVFDLNITGGEATLHPNYLDILRYASQKMLVTLLTNGISLATPEAIGEIVEIPLFDVRMSIYGDEEHHDKFVGQKGAFKKTFEALKLLQKKKGIGTAVLIVNKENFNNIEKIATMIKRENIRLDIITTINPTSQGGISPTKFRITEADYHKTLIDYDLPTHGTYCAAGICRFRISPSGEVNPCELLRHITFGNVYKKPWGKIMEDIAHIEWTNYFSELLENHTCNDCDARKNCNFCPGLFFLENKNMMQPSNYVCTMSYTKKAVALERTKRESIFT